MAFGPVSVGSAPYTLPAATQNTLGGIKVGSNLSVNKGVLSAPAPYTLTADKIKTALGFTPASAAAAATVPYSITYEGCHVGTGAVTSADSPVVFPLSKSYDAMGVITCSTGKGETVNPFSSKNYMRILLELITHESSSGSFKSDFIPLAMLSESWTNPYNLPTPVCVIGGDWPGTLGTSEARMIRKNGNNFEIYTQVSQTPTYAYNTQNVAYHYFGINATGLWTV